MERAAKDLASTLGTAEGRREFPRLSGACVVDYRVVGDNPVVSALDPGESVMQNISGGGICVKMPEAPEKGSMLALNIHMAGFPSSVIALGKVQWVNVSGDSEGFDVGIEFWWVGWEDAEAQAKIRSYISGQLEDEH